MREYSFDDTTIDESVDNAFHALALDEQRAAFTPALWEKSGKSNTVRGADRLVKYALTTFRFFAKSGFQACTRTLAEGTRTKRSRTSPWHG